MFSDRSSGLKGGNRPVLVMDRGDTVATCDFRLTTKFFNTSAKSLFGVSADELEPARFDKFAPVSSSGDEFVGSCLTRRRGTVDLGILRFSQQKRFERNLTEN
jgi:hypothetical protein